MKQDFRRVFLRIVLVCLAVGVVVAATFILTPRFDLKKEEAAERVEHRPPVPGSEAALRKAIAEAQSGVPDYDRIRKLRAQMLANLNPLQHVLVAVEGITVPTNAEMLAEARQQQQDLKKFGPLQSATYMDGSGQFERYRVTFRNGSLLWFISLGKNGALAYSDFGPEGIESPQNFIDNYARFSLHERWGRLAIQLGILLLVAAFGRLALRLRL